MTTFSEICKDNKEQMARLNNKKFVFSLERNTCGTGAKDGMVVGKVSIKKELSSLCRDKRKMS